MKKNKNFSISIHNKFIFSRVLNSNALFFSFCSYYLSKKDYIEKKDIKIDENLVLKKIEIDYKSFFDFFCYTKKSFLYQLKQLSKISLEYKKDKKIIFNTIFNRIEINHNENIIFFIYEDVFNFIFNFYNDFSFFNEKDVFRITNKNTYKMYFLLCNIYNFSENVCKRKEFTLEEINYFFSSNYKTSYDFKRNILDKVKEDFKTLKISLKFNYILNFERLEKTKRFKNFLIELIK